MVYHNSLDTRKKITMNGSVMCLFVLTLVNLGQTHRPPNYARSYSPTSFKWISGYECNGKFKCRDMFSEPKCVDVFQVCDDTCDCNDCSDETLCPQEPKCFSNKQMLCLDKRSCATPCNGRRECPTMGEDEFGCPFTCPDGHYKCEGEEKCIRIDEVCDKKRDCLWGEDEIKCESAECPCGRGHYLCNDGKTCLSIDRVCDNNPDCPDGDDEASCAPGCKCAEGEYLCQGGTVCVSIDLFCNTEPGGAPVRRKRMIMARPPDCPLADDEDQPFCNNNN